MTKIFLSKEAKTIKTKGWEPVYVPHCSKNPGRKGWQKERLTEAEINERFKKGGNLGILTGEPSNGFCDVDLDTRESIACADRFLPPTERIHGRPGSPRSHYWYVVAPSPRIMQWHDTDGTMLLEIRGTGGQTIVPPSVHPGGETLSYFRNGEPGKVELLTLTKACEYIAATALIACHWPEEGSRHKSALAVGGFLLRGGLDKDVAARIVETAARVAGDEEYSDRARDVHYTADKLEAGGTATGALSLAKLPMDRFVSLDADEAGTVITKPFMMNGEDLYVNAEANWGEIYVEIIDAETMKPFPGFWVPAELPAPLTGDHLRAKIHWKPEHDLVFDKPVRIKFYMHQARLYSFWLE